MRNRIISFLKENTIILRILWKTAWVCMEVWGLFVPLQKKTMMFCSYGGRKFDDSPKAIYDEICSDEEFKDWKLIWAFVNPEDFEIPRGQKIRIDTISFFHALLYSHVWVSNSGMDRGIELHRKKNVIVETWHGTPLKKIGGDENTNSLINATAIAKKKKDSRTIRCAQSEYDRDIFSRIFNADKNAILLSDLPRNDELFKYDNEQIKNIKNTIGISNDKKVILYTPTYREYLTIDHETYIAPPMNLDYWKEKLGNEYVLLIRAHYAVSRAMNLKVDDFVKDVSKYPHLNDLYIISDLMISDYSSTFFDYSILHKPMICFAYDLEEYEKKRGLYLDLEQTLPCRIDRTEGAVIEHIINMNFLEESIKTKSFSEKFCPYAGNASRTVVKEIKKNLRRKR